MKRPEWRVIGEDPSGRGRYRVWGQAGPNGTRARIVFDDLPDVDVRGLFPDAPSAMEAAVSEAASVLGS